MKQYLAGKEAVYPGLEQNHFDVKTISKLLSSQDDIEAQKPDQRIFGLSLFLGEHAANEIEYQYAVECLVLLCNRKNARVRANALMGFAYLARTNGTLDKELVFPLLKREWSANIENRDVILTAMEDMNQYLGWGIHQACF